MHVNAEPHIDKQPGASQVADRLAQQEFLSYLMEEVIDRAEQILAKRKSATIGQSFCCR